MNTLFLHEKGEKNLTIEYKNVQCALFKQDEGHREKNWGKLCIFTFKFTSALGWEYNVFSITLSGRHWFLCPHVSNEAEINLQSNFPLISSTAYVTPDPAKTSMVCSSIKSWVCGSRNRARYLSAIESVEGAQNIGTLRSLFKLWLMASFPHHLPFRWSHGTGNYPWTAQRNM